jgi:nicotinamide riboside transporter PnuC
MTAVPDKPNASPTTAADFVRHLWHAWSLRLIFGAALMIFSEIIMWEDPTAHTIPEWIGRAVLYLALAALIVDLAIRLQVREIAGLAMLSGLYGLLSGILINHDALIGLPLGLIVHALGLQTGAALYALLFFVTVMKGHQPTRLEIVIAVAIGVLWGIWLKWYPAQPSVGWEPTTIETATLYLIGGAVIVGGLLALTAPTFRVVRESDLALKLWEWPIVIIPLAIALVLGLLNTEIIPLGPLLIAVVVGAVMVVALLIQRVPNEPSIMAEMLFSLPNPFTFVILSVAVLLAGTFSATIIGDDPNSIIGSATYILIGAIGSLWLPVASAVIGVRVYRRSQEETD